MSDNTPYAQIPLYLVNIGNGLIKVGINISIDNGPFMLYELDTGAAGFYPAAMVPQQPQTPLAWWPGFQTSANVTDFTQAYSSGNTYTAQSTAVTLGFEGTWFVPDGTGYQAQPMPTVSCSVGAIIDATNSGNTAFAANWSDALMAANAAFGAQIPVTAGPLDGYFFGDFGIGLGNAANTGTGEGGPVLAMLPQFPLPLGGSFTIALGKLPESWSSGNVIQQGTLTLGQQEGGTGAVTIYMNPNAAQQTYLPGQTPELFTFDQAQVSATLTLSNNGTVLNLPNVPMVLDTGCPGMMIHLGTNGPLSLGTGGQLSGLVTTTTDTTTGIIKGSVISGTQVSFTPAVTTSFTAGAGGDQVSVTSLTATSAGKQFGYVNTSIQTFFDYTVTFNLLEGTLTLTPTAAQ